MSLRLRLSISGRVLATAAVSTALALSHAAAFAKDASEENGETPYLARDFIFVDSPELEGYLRAVSQRLLDAKGIKMELPNVLLQSSDSFTVFTDSNRNLIVSTGALRAIESEDELAAVLGHELSHLILKHPQNKDAFSALPQGMDAVGSVRGAAAQLRGQGAAVTGSTVGEPKTFGQDGLANAQTASTLWSDFLAPSWNRKQERAADEQGFELMRAAGYDPSAFGTLFQKLHAAEAKRTERMQVLKKSLVGGTNGALADGAAEALIEHLSVFNREYDSPDERQAALSAYAREHREKKRTPAPEMQWQDVVQSGAGAKLLALDADAGNTLDALAAKNPAAASKAVASLGRGDLKQPSAHLNLAVGTFYETSGKHEIGERSAQAWLEARHPPAQAYSWSAWYQSTHQNYAGAIETLEAGRKRVGAAAPFLPNLVSMARLGGDNALAERYTQECASEDRKSAGALKTLLSTPSAPSGLHAECLRRLGYTPAATPSGAVVQTLQSSPSAIGSKFKGLLKR